ncbi:hypothetical protein [Streptomyces sp. NPDC002403]
MIHTEAGAGFAYATTGGPDSSNGCGATSLLSMAVGLNGSKSADVNRENE